MTKAPLNYESHIDGIRAIAVISVLIYHFEFTFIPGGFVGVDMFFVISGFLITRLLIKELNSGNFSFKRFYLRRIRRLAPALLAVLLVSFIVAAIFLTPSHFQRFSGAFLSSVFSVSNFYFWSEAGYFDATATLKPLLHTWSLSVEEQFYLLWPALLLLLKGRCVKSVAWVLIVIGLASLIATSIATLHAPSATFFLMPFRIHEFAIGALLALAPLSLMRGWRMAELLCFLGVGLALLSVLIFSKSTPFPSYNALLPCLAAGLLIAFGTARWSGLLLRNPLSVYLGKISYSLYLVHWPVVVLYKHITFEDMLVGKTRIALLIITFMLAIATHHLIENRFRHPKALQADSINRKRRLALWLGAPLIAIVASAHAYTIDGWSMRFDKQVIQAIGDVNAKQLDRREFIERADSLSNLPFDDWAETRLLVMGDSHSTDAFNALHLANPYPDKVSVRRLEIDDVCLYLFAADGATAEPPHVQARCQEHFDYMNKSALLDDADWVIVSTRWEAESFKYLSLFTDYLHSRKNQILIMGRTAEYKNVPSLVFKRGLNTQTPAILSKARDRKLDQLNRQLASISSELDIAYLDKLPILCDLTVRVCDVVNDDGQILYTDYGHWSLEGARYFGERLWRNTALPQLVLQQ